MRRGALAIVLAAGVASACAGAPRTAIETPSPSASPSVGTSASPDASPTPRAIGKGRVESRTFASAALRRTMPYFVYLPGGYDDVGGARYPVAYLLHGGSGFNTEWIDYGLVDAADRLMGSGALAPFIIVLPQGDQEYWVDHVVDRATGANGEKWGTYTARDVVPEIDRRYRTIAKPEARAIGGISMGGHGALQLSLNFPGIWSIVGAHSPALRPVGDAPTYLGTGAQFADRDPFALIRTKADVARKLTYWIDSADHDPWVTQSTALHEQLGALGIPHEWRSDPGGHDAAYWESHMDVYLGFYAASLCRDRSLCPAAP